MSEFLDTIDGPEDLRKLSEEDLPELCAEIREFLIDRVHWLGGARGGPLRVLWPVGIGGFFHTGPRADAREGCLLAG